MIGRPSRGPETHTSFWAMLRRAKGWLRRPSCRMGGDGEPIAPNRHIVNAAFGFGAEQTDNLPPVDDVRRAVPLLN